MSSESIMMTSMVASDPKQGLREFGKLVDVVRTRDASQGVRPEEAGRV